MHLSSNMFSLAIPCKSRRRCLWDGWWGSCQSREHPVLQTVTLLANGPGENKDCNEVLSSAIGRLKHHLTSDRDWRNKLTKLVFSPLSIRSSIGEWLFTATATPQKCRKMSETELRERDHEFKNLTFAHPRRNKCALSLGKAKTKHG